MNDGTWSPRNLIGTPLVIIGIVVGAMLGIFGVTVLFKGHVQL